MIAVPSPVTMAVLMAFVPVAAVIIMAVATALFVIARHIFIPVPVVPDKIHGPAARLVLSAMLLPMLFVAGRHMQIDRLADVMDMPFDDDRLRIDHLWLRDIADVDATVETRFADIDRYTDIGGHRGGSRDKQSCCNNESSHDVALSYNEWINTASDGHSKHGNRARLHPTLGYCSAGFGKRVYGTAI